MMSALLTMVSMAAGQSATGTENTGPHVCAAYAFGTGFRAGNLVKAIAIGMAESRCTTWASGPDPLDQGLWQIRAFAERVRQYGDLTIPENNARAAYDLSAAGTNWQTHWAATNCEDASNIGCYAYWMDSARNAAEPYLVDHVNQVNGDGFADLVGVDAAGVLFGYHNGSLVNPGGQPFWGQTWRLPSSNWTTANHLATGDISGDGYADLVAARSDGSLVIYFNGSLVNPGGLPYHAATWTYQGSWQHIRQLAVADVTGDRFADLVFVDRDGALVVYVNGSRVNPGGSPFTSHRWRLGNWSAVRHLALTDVNHDGYADVVAVDGNGQLFGYHNGALVNAGGQPFLAETWRINGNWSGTRQFTAGDVNRDGYGDLIAVEADGSLSTYNNGILVNPGGRPYGARTWNIPGNWTAVRTIA